MTFKTEQETFWHGEFGDEYVERNQGLQLKAGNIHLFSKIFDRTKDIKSVLEFGANIGMNLVAIKDLLPAAKINAVEINEKAASCLKDTIPNASVFNQSIFDFDTSTKADFVYTSGVLIHINPDELPNVYEKMYESSNKYIAVIEYYNPAPVAISYRGHSNKLFKRDFAGEIMDKYPNLKLVDYGFAYHRDNNFPRDDLNWFLLEK